MTEEIESKPETVDVTKRGKTRKVFARRMVMVEGHEVRFEMREDGLYVWRNRARKQRKISFGDLYIVSTGQNLLPL